MRNIILMILIKGLIFWIDKLINYLFKLEKENIIVVSATLLFGLIVL